MSSAARPRFPLPDAPKGPDFEDESEMIDALRVWFDYYEEERRYFRCGKCQGRFGEGQLAFNAPTIWIDGCSHRQIEPGPDGKRSKSGVRGLSINGKEKGPGRYDHPRPGRWVWESSQFHRDGPRWGHRIGERQYTFECRCGMRRSVRNRNLVGAFCDALTTGREIVIGVDV